MSSKSSKTNIQIIDKIEDLKTASLEKHLEKTPLEILSDAAEAHYKKYPQNQ